MEQDIQDGTHLRLAGFFAAGFLAAGLAFGFGFGLAAGFFAAGLGLGFALGLAGFLASPALPPPLANRKGLSESGIFFLAVIIALFNS